MLILNNIVKQHSKQFILEVSNLQFKDGLVYGVVGPNGSGKTTLLNIASLIQNPDRGELIYNNEKITDKNRQRLRKKITMVMENPYLFHTTVFNNIALALRCRGIKKKLFKETVRYTLNMVGLEGFESRNAWTLSGGERQRTALARALATQPDMLLLDEPFSNIDRNTTTLLEHLISRIADETGTAIIFTTHVLARAYHLSNSIIHLLNGKITDTEMENLFPCTIEEDSGGSIQYAKISNEVSISVLTDIRGKAAVSISPHDILLSHKPVESSARNSFYGIIKTIQIENNSVRLIVTVNKSNDFTVIITRRSFEEMGLNTGIPVYLLFKSTAVKCI